MASIASDLVASVAAASYEATAFHYARFFQSTSNDSPKELARVAKALDHGYDGDLDELLGAKQVVGFDHGLISQIYQRHLISYFPAKGPGRHICRHIWEADEDRAIYSLFGREPLSEDTFPLRTRTRASAILQTSLRHCRTMRHPEKATKRPRTINSKATPSELVTIPSPLNISRQLITDTESPASHVYAVAALQELIRERINEAADGALDLSFASLTSALITINNRWRTSKPIKANLRQNGPAVLFLCNLFAMQGLMALRIHPQHFVEVMNMSAANRHLKSRPAKIEADEARKLNRRLWDLITGQDAGEAEFMVDPQFNSLPDAGEILNTIDGLPVPLVGATTVFQGGLRLSNRRSSVVAISGPFGAGKTLLCLSMAAALAPLGCRTLFLSCEERREDLEARLAEAAPRGLEDAAALFRGLEKDDFSVDSFVPEVAKDGYSGDLRVSWFKARQLELSMGAKHPPDTTEVVLDPAAALSTMLTDAIQNAELFKPFASSSASVPSFARPIIIIDGLHQLFDPAEAGHAKIDLSLRQLVETCRDLGAIFIFSFSSESHDLKRLEYLCDSIIELGREGYDSPSEKPKRIFRLLKARRQPARTGAHIFHLKSGEGFRIKPSLDALVHASKSQRWWEPDERGEIFLSDETPPGFRAEEDPSANPLAVRNRSQILVIGRGSAGKAGFGLYLLHRRWFDRGMIATDDKRRNQSNLWADDEHEMPLNARALAIAESELPVRHSAEYLETRVLVISFLYQSSYYQELTTRLSRLRRGKAFRGRPLLYGTLNQLREFPFTPLPDRLHTDTIELYPGQLGVEEFLAKVDRQLQAAELLGLPYTGVMLDGLHNVFVQYPGLEAENNFWGVFYNLLRRRRVTVVTTHTEFDIKSFPDASPRSSAHPLQRPLLLYDFEQAQRKIAPLLAAMVSGSDYLFNLSVGDNDPNDVAQLSPINGLGVDVSSLRYQWNRTRMRLKSLAFNAR